MQPPSSDERPSERQHEQHEGGDGALAGVEQRERMQGDRDAAEHQPDLGASGLHPATCRRDLQLQILQFVGSQVELLELGGLSEPERTTDETPPRKNEQEDGEQQPDESEQGEVAGEAGGVLFVDDSLPNEEEGGCVHRQGDDHSEPPGPDDHLSTSLQVRDMVILDRLVNLLMPIDSPIELLPFTTHSLAGEFP